jgi:hypothetical protein
LIGDCGRHADLPFVRTSANGKKRKPKSEVENLPPQNHQKARDAAGKAVGASGRTVDFATKVLTHGTPESVPTGTRVDARAAGSCC